MQANSIMKSLYDSIYLSPHLDDALYASEEALFSRIHAADYDLSDDLFQYMTNLPMHQRILIPLAVGHHMDHQLVRSAAERWPSKTNFAYYEEYPYARDPALIRAALTPEEG